jgi:hypothetical protein
MAAHSPEESDGTSIYTIPAGGDLIQDSSAPEQKMKDTGKKSCPCLLPSK